MPNFLADYATYTDGDEAPKTYHLWCGLSALSSILSRRVWLNLGRIRIYPNLYVILLGPPGNGKTTAMVVAKELIRELNELPFSAESQTKESLVRELAGYIRQYEYQGKPITYTPISIFVTELSHFLGPNSGHMLDFLTTVYDQDYYDAKTKNKGNDLIVGPTVNLLACTTPEWITTYLRADIITGGFTRRAIFINEFEGELRVAFPKRTAEQMKAREALLVAARRLLTISGEVKWSDAAVEWWTKWYIGRELPSDPTVRYYYKTRHIQILKVAIILAVIEDTFTLTVNHIEVAMSMFELIETNLGRVFQGMGRNELNNVGQKILDLVEMHDGKVAEKQVYAIMFKEANTAELAAVIEHLQRTDKLRRFSVKEGKVERIVLAGLDVAEKLAAQQAAAPVPASSTDSAKSTDQPSSPATSA